MSLNPKPLTGISLLSAAQQPSALLRGYADGVYRDRLYFAKDKLAWRILVTPAVPNFLNPTKVRCPTLGALGLPRPSCS